MDSLEVAAQAYRDYASWLGRELTQPHARNWVWWLVGLSAAAYLWLARVEAREGAGGEAIALYRRGLELDPKKPRAWLELGHLLRSREPAEALDAYGQSCHRGDPGANACWLAGQIAEELGDVEAAIDWYERSRWPPARQRLEQLRR